MKLLYICHRIPYPPNKGEKIRSYNILRYLAKRHEVYLAYLVDEPHDMEHLETLRSMVQGVYFDTIHNLTKKIRSGLTMLGSKPISVSYFYSQNLQRSIDNLLRKVEIDTIFCSSSPTAEYLFSFQRYNGKLRRSKWIMDLIDVDSHKWRQYAGKCKGVKRWVYLREAKSLRRYEKRIAKEFDRLLLVSEAERDLFLQNISADNVFVMSNGVDLEYFSPGYDSRIVKTGRSLVFTGAMHYRPNIEGVEWFVEKVLPKIQKSIPDVTFYVVGNRPSPAVRRLAKKKGVKVTGYVEDVRDFLAAADVCVVPLRIARGIQNKVLEAMAMAKAVVCTPQALEGIKAVPGRDVLVEYGDEGFAASVIRLLTDHAFLERTGQLARQCVEEGYAWDANLSQLERMITPLEPSKQELRVGGLI